MYFLLINGAKIRFKSYLTHKGNFDTLIAYPIKNRLHYC